MNIFQRYFNWLQQDAPSADVEVLPAIDEDNQTSVSGIYIAGELSGIPLLTLASDSGVKVAEHIAKNDFKSLDEVTAPVIIVGSGPAGISAAIKLKELGVNSIILEASRPFNTIENFPTGKPIHIDPNTTSPGMPLPFTDGTKESLLEELTSALKQTNIDVKTSTSVQNIKDVGDKFEVHTNNGKFSAYKIILAMGKSGDARNLGIPGEDLPKVFNRLFDPQEYCEKKIVVVGGGDAALETAVALAKCGGEVTLSYRKDNFARPKENNLKAFNELVKSNKIKAIFSSKLTEVSETSVTIKTKDEEVKLPNDVIFTMIGRKLPTQFFKDNSIRLADEKDGGWWFRLIALLSFFTMLYFGKKGNAYDIFSGLNSWYEKAYAFFTAPWQLANKTGLAADGLFGSIRALFHAPFNAASGYGLNGYSEWLNSICFLIGWAGAIVFIVFGLIVGFSFIYNAKTELNTWWKRGKVFYIASAAIAFTYIYINSTFTTAASWVNDPTQWYSLLYCLTMLIFGIRRVYKHRTRYILYQVCVLVFIQIVFLYLLPFGKFNGKYIFDIIFTSNFADASWFQQVFPIGRWTSFWFILIWPLSIGAFGTTLFWTIFPVIQLIALFFAIREWGKGVYCGWICSCGGMAETFGDEYRTISPHGTRAKKLENIGQFVLLFAIGATILHLASKFFPETSSFGETIYGLYLLSIDIIFAGVLGLGVYFFMGGRIWCRYGCPLAAIMHVMTRFSKYRILSEKKKCISCSICTKVCHMGIDVMNFANKGIPMNDVECVRCSTCVHSCPMGVLAFGKVDVVDTENKSRKEIPDNGKETWQAGIK